MGPWLERTALPKLLAHAAYRGHAKTEELRNLASTLAPLIEMNNSLADRDRYGCHSPYSVTESYSCQATLFMEML